MLQIQNVTKKYQTKAGEVNALDGISLTFPETGLVFITGKSGCGKTTLLNVIGGLDGIDDGEILIQDKKFSSFSAAEYDSYRNTFIGFIFQEYNLLPEYTVEKNIKIAMELQGRKAEAEEFETLLKDVEIDALRKRKPSELSGGQRQRVAIARALVKQPRIIMADEPTGALDSGTGVQVLDTLKKLSKKTLVIIVSHDQEFAEKYADRIIHLEDGRVVQDVTFLEKEITSNVSEQENKLIVREGAELSEAEKNALAKAVKERKQIEIIEKPSFRDKEPTGEVKLRADEPVSLRKSRMKLKSEAYLGVKSLAVKPIRLFFTIIIAALAFAVFGICDTIANFSTAKILKNQLKISPSKTVVATTDYIVDYEKGESYPVKISPNAVDGLQSQTGGTVKGIFDLDDDRYRDDKKTIKQSFAVAELSSANVSVGKKYYTAEVNGFIEFEKGTEISKEGKFRDFGYTLVAGEYPQLRYNSSGVLDRDSLYEVAISSYLADSIIHYLNGRSLDEKTIETREDLFGARITVNKEPYTIVGIIDCGGIPDRYDALKQATSYNTMQYSTLEGDFKSYIDSTAQKCLFVAKDFLQVYKDRTEIADIFHIGNASWTLSVQGGSTKTQIAPYLYAAEYYDSNNVLLFDRREEQDGTLSLADDEILIRAYDLNKLFSSKIAASPNQTQIKQLINKMQTGTAESNREALSQIFDLLHMNLSEEPIVTTIHQRAKTSTETQDKEVKIAGVYFGVDPDYYTASPLYYRLMMNKNLMKELNVFSEQGDYCKVLFSARSVQNGKNAIVNYLLTNDGLAMTWYNNSVLNVIRTNETTIRQGADLFFYVDIALSVFAIFMLFTYISTSIARKKRSVGVLRALGAGGKNILLTFLIESLIIAVINGILANVFAVIGCALVNTYIVETMHISVHFALFGIRQIFLISGVSLLTAVVSSTLPIVKISKKKPVELIRRS